MGVRQNLLVECLQEASAHLEVGLVLFGLEMLVPVLGEDNPLLHLEVVGDLQKLEDGAELGLLESNLKVVDLDVNLELGLGV